MRRIFFIVALLLPLFLSADVFWRFKKSYSRVLQDLGGAQVYSTPVQVNGTAGTLNAYSFEDKSSSEIGSQLKRRLSLAKDPALSASSMITTQEDGRVQRFLVIPAANGAASSVVLMFEQSLQEAKKRSADEPLAWPEGLSMLPGVPRFTATSAATRTAFVTAETAQEPEAAMTAVESALSGNGWQSVPVATATFKLFVRGSKTCVAFAMRPAGAAQTTLSVMQRDGSEKND